jgi:protein-disulfide isomerase
MSKWTSIALGAGFGLLGGFVGASLAGLVPLPHPGMDRAVRDYILAHPEILPEAIDKLKANDSAKAVAQIAPQAEKEWAGAVLGNPKGKTVLVEFMDFACTYCKASEEDVARLIAGNPDLKVVIRQLPILSPESVDAAKMGLAAAAQGKYAAFHRSMFALGRPDAQSIEAAANQAGIDLVAARKVITQPAVLAELEANVAMARKLGANGTPSWIAHGQLLGGAVGFEALGKAIKDTRG